MMKMEVIGHLGADVEVVEIDGSKFATCRVAHTDKYKGKDGTPIVSTQWVEVSVRHDAPIVPYLKKGTLLYVRGDVRLRVYSSEKDRCYKAGVRIFATETQLLGGGKQDEQSQLQKDINHGKVF